LTGIGSVVGVPVATVSTVAVVSGAANVLAGVQSLARLITQPGTGGGGGSRAPPNAKNGETAATQYGRQAHTDWNAGKGFRKEVRLPSGKRPDAVNWDTQTVKELKPDNHRAIQRGEKQLEGYRKELENMTGEKWTGILETYTRKP
jgi:hypothetical protein